MLINKNYCFRYETSGELVIRKFDPAFLPYFNKAKTKFFYVETHLISDQFKKIPLSTIIENELLSNIRDLESDVYLFIHTSNETFYQNIKAIYDDVIIGDNIPVEKIVFAAEGPEVDLFAEEVAREKNMPKLKTANSWVEVPWSVSTLRYRHMLTNGTLQEKQYNKKYIYLNHRWRFHRAISVALLKINNLLDQGYVSLQETEHETWEKIWTLLLKESPPEYVTSVVPHKQINQLLEQHKDEIWQLKKLEVDDLTNLSHEKIAHPRLELAEYYNNTYFSVISETNYYRDRAINKHIPFYTEKTFKTILMKHPFILLSAPGTLKWLKRRGYLTFDGIIDESYDEIVNDGDRMLAVISEIKRLCSLEGNELKEFLTVAKARCEHNFNMLSVHKMDNYFTINFQLP